MKKSREEERLNRRAKPKAESRQGSSSTSNQPTNSKVPLKQRNEKHKKGKQQFHNKPQDVEQLFHELLNISESADVCENLLPFLNECDNPFQNNQDDSFEKLYICPEISDEILPKYEWLDKIQNYIALVHESDPILSAILAVKSLNSKEKADECFSIIIRCLKNIIEYPENDKYRHIRCHNPIVEGKVLNTEGAVLFMGAIGFEMNKKNELSELYLSFNQNHYHLKEVVNLINNVKGFQLTPFEDKEMTNKGQTVSDGDREDNFYKLTSTDLKENQRLRALEIEKESQLRTRSTREKEKRLTPTSKYTKIRIRSPEGKLVESTFEITDRLLQVHQFIERNMTNGRKYLLFMPPATPFKDSDKDRTLADLQLFPAVLLTLKWVPSDNKVCKGKK